MFLVHQIDFVYEIVDMSDGLLQSYFKISDSFHNSIRIHGPHFSIFVRLPMNLTLCCHDLVHKRRPLKYDCPDSKPY